MFAKSYKIKSTNSLKNTDKKNLLQRILDTFPAAKEETVKDLVPAKSSTSCLKLVLHSGETVAVFAVDSVPVMIDTEAGLVPTVCALWKLPDLVPTITIHTPVLGKILNGAPLYLPGVEIPYHGIGFPMFARGAVLAARTADNMAAALIGRAAMGSGDMLLKAAGVCLDTIHVFGDLLCKEQKFAKIERPRLDPKPVLGGDTELLTDSVSQLSILSIPKPVEQWPALGRSRPVLRSAPPRAPEPSPAPVLQTQPSVPAPVPNAPRLIPERDSESDVLNDSITSEGMEDEENQIPEDMDGLLRWCLLCFLRLEGKNLELPLKTSSLYRNHLVPLCPPERSLDVKKSTYKKMSKFLEAMQREGLIEVKEVEKGVDAVTAVNLVHPIVRAHRVPSDLRERLRLAEEEDKEQTDYVPPVVREVLCVTAAVNDLFPGVRKGTPLTAPEVRAVLTEYVKTRNLNATQQKGSVVLDILLAKILGKQEQEVVKWDVLMSSVSSRMTSGTELRWADGETKLIKSKLEPITMQVATRSGNKKVTLVNNLEAYGFSLLQLSTVCQRGVGASCGVTRSPGSKADQLMLQGDQTHFVAKLLVEKYGLPKKFVDGADKALNKKK